MRSCFRGILPIFVLLLRLLQLLLRLLLRLGHPVVLTGGIDSSLHHFRSSHLLGVRIRQHPTSPQIPEWPRQSQRGIFHSSVSKKKINAQKHGSIRFSEDDNSRIAQMRLRRYSYVMGDNKSKSDGSTRSRDNLSSRWRIFQASSVFIIITTRSLSIQTAESAKLSDSLAKPGRHRPTHQAVSRRPAGQAGRQAGKQPGSRAGRQPFSRKSNNNITTLLIGP